MRGAESLQFYLCLLPGRKHTAGWVGERYFRNLFQLQQFDVDIVSGKGGLGSFLSNRLTVPETAINSGLGYSRMT